MDDDTLQESEADRAVRKVFAILGVNIDQPESVEEFRADLRFGKSLRKAADKGMGAVITVLVGGVLVALWSGLVNKIGGH